MHTCVVHVTERSTEGLGAAFFWRGVLRRAAVLLNCCMCALFAPPHLLSTVGRQRGARLRGEGGRAGGLVSRRRIVGWQSAHMHAVTDAGCPGRMEERRASR